MKREGRRHAGLFCCWAATVCFGQRRNCLDADERGGARKRLDHVREEFDHQFV
jgi:hypothetical protein